MIKQIVIKIILIAIFSVSAYLVFEFDADLVTINNEYSRPGYIGGAIGFGLIASASLLGFIYFDCQCSRKDIK